jgi:hypothetical protein
MAIAYLRDAHNDAASVTTLGITITVNIGDCVVVVVDEALSTVLSVTGGGTYTQLASKVGGRQTEIWGCLSATSGVSTVTVNMNASANINVDVICYSGVTGFGNIGTNSASPGTAMSVSLTLQAGGNWMVAGFGMDGNPGASANLGANWSDKLGHWAVISGAADETTAVTPGLTLWAGGPTFANDQFAQTTVANLGSANEFVGPAVRVSGTTGYLAVIQGAGGSNPGVLRCDGSGSWTSLGSAVSTFVNGDVAKLQITGTTINLYRNGTLFCGPFTDATYSTGQPGMGSYQGGLSLSTVATSWAGGDGILSNATDSFVRTSSWRVVGYSSNQGSEFLTVGDNTSASAGSLSISVTNTNSTDWQACAVELKSAVPVPLPPSMLQYGLGF